MARPVYWHSTFQERGYVAPDVLRGPLSDNPGAEQFHRTDTFFYSQYEPASNTLAAAIGTPDPFIRSFAGSLAINLKRQS